ncbi:MAG: hypothetical protein WDW38_004549 [Sanguina aurantia]
MWALRFRQFFNGRREYLEKSTKQKDDNDPPDFLVDMEKRYAEQEADLQGLKQQMVKVNTNILYGPGAPRPQQPPTLASSLQADSVKLGLTNAEMLDDIKQARMDLRTNPSAQATTAILRTRTFIIDLILFPIRMMQAIGSAWQAAFKTQRYENFLMAEGERIWFWRNRMENERWFWEIYFFERLLGRTARSGSTVLSDAGAPLGKRSLRYCESASRTQRVDTLVQVPPPPPSRHLFPPLSAPAALLGSLAYMLVVPNNIVWAVVVPLCFYFWQNGQWPSPTTPELWVISYVGLYLKSWPGISSLFTSLFLVW